MSSAVCSSTSTFNHQHSFSCTLRAAMALFATISTTLSGSVSKDVPRETTNQVLGNAYTIVIALYLLWIMENMGDLSLLSFLVGTMVAILLPSIAYVPLSSYLASGTDTKSPAVLQKTERNRGVEDESFTDTITDAAKPCSTPKSHSARRRSTSPIIKRPRTLQRTSDPFVYGSTKHAQGCQSATSRKISLCKRRGSSDSTHTQRLCHSPPATMLGSVSPFKTPVKRATDNTIDSKASDSSSKSRTAAKIKQIFSIHRRGRRQSV